MKQKHYITGQIETPVGKIKQIATVWSGKDICQTIRVRWSIGRMDYKVKQGLYAVGTPDENSNIFVTANFKLSFDHLRRALHGMNAWVLILDTKGVNVWCAAGKGTFGTRELSYRILTHKLAQLVSHRKIIVPQLGATGVSAHEVFEKTGFKVVYGPVRAEDISDFVSRNCRATPEMRKMTFPLKERLKLIPVELAYGKYYLLLVPAIFFLLAGLSSEGYSINTAWKNGGLAVINLFTAYFMGCVLTPALLPWIPFTRFSWKGLLLGWIAAGLYTYLQFTGTHIIEIISWFLIMGSISSFLAMNFTGSSTFTSLSGVQKEMKTALPMQIIFAALGIIGWIITRFI
ncbi:MAG: mercury methylation corrinoid protein HgcA [Bacteroidota bacterium]